MVTETSMGAYFAQKQSHMVSCSDDIFDQWVEIIEYIERGLMA